jgi:GPI-anchor transamidase subunit K
VTDFFGGVAQAEVLPSIPVSTKDGTNSTSHGEGSYEAIDDVALLSIEDAVLSYKPSDSYDLRAAHIRSQDFVQAFEHQRMDRGAASVIIRSWASIALAGTLVAWVVRTQRKK